jgi:glycosyltransferase involved in cell wall biosynthesis
MSIAPTQSPEIAVVAIGRNEGERLRACLRSVVDGSRLVVYVDSGSTDGSVELAKSMGAEVVQLDLSIPFTAARARNAGFKRVLELRPHTEFVQFIDGDCEVREDWFTKAIAAMASEPRRAVVCGRRRERFPEASLYNTLCDIEWDTPVGPALACGGDALVRASALKEIGGYRDDVIAGEEPEMCVRLRQAGWTIERIDAEMTLHDAAMTRFGQWWRRTVRSGHAYAEGAHLHGAPPERHWVKDVRRIVFYAAVLPIVAIALAWPTWGGSLALFLLYPLSAWRASRAARLRGRTPREARLYAFFVTLGKFPQMVGILKFHWRRLSGSKPALIEYKTAAAHTPGQA